jgi:hypothetical protein
MKNNVYSASILAVAAIAIWAIVPPIAMEVRFERIIAILLVLSIQSAARFGLLKLVYHETIRQVLTLPCVSIQLVTIPVISAEDFDFDPMLKAVYALGGPFAGAAVCAAMFEAGVLFHCTGLTGTAHAGLMLSGLGLIPIWFFDGGYIMKLISERLLQFGTIAFCVLEFATISAAVPNGEVPLQVMGCVLASLSLVGVYWLSDKDFRAPELEKYKKVMLGAFYLGLASIIKCLYTMSA